MSSAGHQPLQPRSTVVIVKDNEILLVKRRNESLWALPGGGIEPADDPETRAVISVAEATGLRITNRQPVGEYAGRVSANQVFLAEAEGTLQPNPRHIDDARWWDLQEELPLQDHVTAIVNLVCDWRSVEESDETATSHEEVPAPFEEEIPHEEDSGRSFFYRLGPLVASAGLAAWTGLKALFLALRIAGTGVVYATDGLIALSLTFQGTRPKPLPHRSFPKGTRETLRRAQGNRCVYCGVNLRAKATHIDHIIPLAQGGPHVMANWQLLCHRCNLRKGARNDQEFRYRFRVLLSPRQGDIPAQTIRQREIDRIAKLYADAASFQNFKAGKYYTPGQKVTVGGIVAGFAVGVLLFWLTYEAFSPADASLLGLVSAVLGIATWAWVRLRAWYTGRDRESDADG